MFSHTAIRALLPFECAICKAWPCRALDGVSGICKICLEQHVPAAHQAVRYAIPNGLDECVAVVNFEPPWSGLIARFKFAQEPGLALMFSALLKRDERVRLMLQQVSVVMPMPLTPARLAERGFNQALLLAQHMSQNQRHHIDSQTLIKIRDAPPQRTLNRSARMRNLVGAFVVSDQRCLNQHVLLVDDVMTTGATLSAAATPLRAAGAASVSAVVIARTPLLHT